MPKSHKLEALLDRLAQLRTAPISQEAIASISQILASKYGVAVAQAARLVETRQITPLIPQLVASFSRFMSHPAETDPSCLAKTGIAEALYRLNYSEETLFLQGIRHIQLEPVWGGQTDTAATLRGTCAMGLVRMNYPHVLTELGDLLADPEPPARIAAARAIAYSENAAGVPLLRLRARVGDEPPVVAECLIALLKLAPQQSLDFAAHFLHDPQPQTQELTALALGESHLADAFEPLQQWWKTTADAELQQTALLAIAMLRHDAAMQFLLELIANRPIKVAQAAIAALEPYKTDKNLWQQVQTAVQQRDDAKLMAKANPSLVAIAQKN
jgi:HEAT repeats